MLTVIRRRGGVAVLAAIVVTAVSYYAGSHRSATYSAQAVAVVAANRQLTPDQANRLALTDAGLIPTDTAIASAVAKSLGTNSADVLRRVSVFNDPDTALLHISYRGTSATNAMAGDRSVVASIVGRHPASPNIEPGSISVVRLPTRASSSKGLKTILAIGILLGLALGTLLAVAWERTDPRVDDLEVLNSEARCPTSASDGLSDAAANALLERWRILGGVPRASIAILPAAPKLERHLPNLAHRLAAADDTRQTLVVSRSATAVAGNPALVLGGAPDSRSGGQGVALACNLTVIAAESGMRREDLRKALDLLREFGVTPAWALLVSKRSLREAPVRAQPPVPESQEATTSS